jgi:hypothetical protein
MIIKQSYEITEDVLALVGITTPIIISNNRGVL